MKQLGSKEIELAGRNQKEFADSKLDTNTEDLSDDPDVCVAARA